MLVVITVCENQENSENNDNNETNESEPRLTKREVDESSGSCVGKQQNQVGMDVKLYGAQGFYLFIYFCYLQTV